MGPYDVVYVARDGSIDTARYDRAATAALLQADSAVGEVFAIQMICGRYEVYRISDIQWRHQAWLKGPPVFVTEDYDAAITWAVLMCGRVE